MIGDPSFSCDASEVGLSFADALERRADADSTAVGGERRPLALRERSAEVIGQAAELYGDGDDPVMGVGGERFTGRGGEAIPRGQRARTLGGCARRGQGLGEEHHDGFL
jgi:hypothetical protein